MLALCQAPQGLLDTQPTSVIELPGHSQAVTHQHSGNACPVMSVLKIPFRSLKLLDPHHLFLSSWGEN